MENTVEYFIERVRSRPCLWNQNHVSYRDIGKKDLTWERIAKECGMANGREAKTQWKKLRDSHREALRRRKPSHGPTALYLRPWKYEEDMKFIVTQMETKDSIYSNDSNYLEDNINDSTTEAHNSIIEIPVQVPLPKSMPSQDSSDPLNSEPDSKRDIAELVEERERLKEEREKHRDEMLRQAVEFSRSDALSKFFDSLCQKTRELPKYLQLRIQREIFESVTRAEEEALSLNASMSGYSGMPSESSDQQNTTSPRESQEDYASETEYERKFSVDSS